MTRPDFYEGLHPQLDCDLANKRKLEYMTELEEQVRRLEHVNGHEKNCRHVAETIGDEMVLRCKELVELVKRATTDSVVTTSSDPGCFYCDKADDCREDCPARIALAKVKY